MRLLVLLAEILLAASTSWAQTPDEGLTFRFLVDSTLRPPSSTLEWVDGSPDAVLCFDGIAQDPSNDHRILGTAIGCARIVAQYPLERGDVVLGLKVRHIVTLTRGDIVDDDFAIVVPLLDSPTLTYSHGLTATTDVDNIRPELGTRFYQGRGGTVGVNGTLDLRDFPNRIRFNALFTIRFTN
jgi:hypothetical protein